MIFRFENRSGANFYHAKLFAVARYRDAIIP